MPPFARHASRLLLPIALIGLFAAAMLSLTHTQAQPLSATYTRGTLSVSIPYHSTRKGPGKLVAEILDPEDHVLGRSERNLDVGNGDGFWQQSITPDQPIAFEDMVWQRIRYRFEYADGALPAIEGIESISEILRRPVVRILGQSEYLAGSQAAIRILVSDASQSDDAAAAIRSGTVRVELIVPNQQPAQQPVEPGQQPRPLFSGRLNRGGTLEAQFRFPAGLTGAAELHFIADTPIGSTEYTQPIRLDDKASILLTTEKPIYQPGQTIHVRALALDRDGHQADAARKLTFELEDSRGNRSSKRSQRPTSSASPPPSFLSPTRSISAPTTCAP